MRRKCNKCGKIKDTKYFSIKRKIGDVVFLQTECKKCTRLYLRAHYAKNKQKYIRKAKIYDKKNKEAIMKNVLAYLLEHPCIGCGEANPVILEFDHRDPKTKISEISTLVSVNRNSWETVKQEIDKCDIRCANCHRMKTAKERNYLIYQLWRG